MLVRARRFSPARSCPIAGRCAARAEAHQQVRDATTAVVLEAFGGGGRTDNVFVQTARRPARATEPNLSQPGLGPVLGARVLAEFGDDSSRYAGARARKNYSGTPGDGRVPHRPGGARSCSTPPEACTPKDAIAGRLRRLLTLADDTAHHTGIPDTHHRPGDPNLTMPGHSPEGDTPLASR